MSYLEELLTLNDKTILKAKAKEFLSKLATFDGNSFNYNAKAKKRWLGSGSSCVSCIYGEYNWNWSKYQERQPPQCYVKNGIEVLNMLPNATGSTYSKKCRITVKELKEKCKLNGIKPIGDKKTLLNALMKI